MTRNHDDPKLPKARARGLSRRAILAGGTAGAATVAAGSASAQSPFGWLENLVDLVRLDLSQQPIEVHLKILRFCKLEQMEMLVEIANDVLVLHVGRIRHEPPLSQTGGDESR